MSFSAARRRHKLEAQARDIAWGAQHRCAQLLDKYMHVVWCCIKLCLKLVPASSAAGQRPRAGHATGADWPWFDVYAEIHHLCNNLHKMQLQYTNQYAEICKFTQYRNSIRTNTHIYANGIRTDTHDKWFTQSIRMIRNQYANDNMQIYTIAIHKSISRDTQSYMQYSNSIRTNMHIYANGIYAHISRIYANDLRSQYA